MRICITGGPQTGKTTLAKWLLGQLGGNSVADYRTTDDLKGLEWSGVSDAAAAWLAEPARGRIEIIEGVALVRALRKAMERTDDAPCNFVLHMTQPKRSGLKAGHEAMAKGEATIWGGIALDLQLRGVSIMEEEMGGVPELAQALGLSLIHIGDVVVVPASQENPYAPLGLCGRPREEALREWSCGTAPDGLALWHAPASGGARRIVPGLVDWSGLRRE